MRITKIAKDNYFRFCNLEGNDCIASEFALEKILKLIIKFDVSSVLELGAGIGSISDTVLKLSEIKGLNIRYVATEANEYCNRALKENVEHYEKLEHYQNLAEIDENAIFDLIIIDGQDETLNMVAQHCKKNVIIFIEGDRSPQRELVMNLFPEALYANIICLRKNKDYAHSGCDPKNYVGGGQLIFVNPDVIRKIYWFHQKVKTYVIRKIREIA